MDGGSCPTFRPGLSIDILLLFLEVQYTLIRTWCPCFDGRQVQNVLVCTWHPCFDGREVQNVLIRT